MLDARLRTSIMVAPVCSAASRWYVWSRLPIARRATFSAGRHSFGLPASASKRASLSAVRLAGSSPETAAVDHSQGRDSNFPDEDAGARGAAAAAAACPNEDDALADARFGALRMMQHGAGRMRQRGLMARPLRGGSGGVVSENDESKGVRKSTVQDRQFLTHDGASGRTLVERQRNSAFQRLSRGVSAASDYRAGRQGGFSGTGGASLEGKELDEIDQDVEDQIQMAIANGEFDKLEGKGKPLTKLMAYDNPYLDGGDRIGFALLQKHGFAPEWIEQQRRVREDLDRIVTNLAEAWAAGGGEPTLSFVAHKEEFRRELTQLSRRVRDYNLSCPVAAQLPMPVLADEVRRAKRQGEAALVERRKELASRASMAAATLPKAATLRSAFRAVRRTATAPAAAGGGSVLSRMADAFRTVGRSPDKQRSP